MNAFRCINHYSDSFKFKFTSVKVYDTLKRIGDDEGYFTDFGYGLEMKRSQKVIYFGVRGFHILYCKVT